MSEPREEKKRTPTENSLCFVIRQSYSDGDSIECIKGEDLVTGAMLRKAQRMIRVYWGRLQSVRALKSRARKVVQDV